jgi:hypothetical protein
MNPPLFSLHYLPCISYISELVKHEEILIEKQENFIKQTYRNRCKIFSANGTLPLIIPIEHGGSQLIYEINTQSETDWKRHHWQSIISAYNNSPYFLYYKDKFEAIYFDKNIHTLFEFNIKLLELSLKLLKINIEIRYTEVFVKDYELDFRNHFSAKKMDFLLTEFKPYYQVFDSKFGFQSNLSIIDLIFSQGPDSKHYFI